MLSASLIVLHKPFETLLASRTWDDEFELAPKESQMDFLQSPRVWARAMSSFQQLRADPRCILRVYLANTLMQWRYKTDIKTPNGAPNGSRQIVERVPSFGWSVVGGSWSWKITQQPPNKCVLNKPTLQMQMRLQGKQSGHKSWFVYNMASRWAAVTTRPEKERMPLNRVATNVGASSSQNFTPIFE